MQVIVFLLNCKISDLLPAINSAQVGDTLKDINAGRNSSRDAAQKAEMKAKAGVSLGDQWSSSQRENAIKSLKASQT